MQNNITPEQYDVLLKPLNGTRVAKRKQAGQSLSYLEAWDVKAHMIRVFGFTGWSWDVIEAHVAFEDTVLSKSGGENWNVGYKVIGCLRVGGASYTEAAVGSATLPSRGDAHDMAVKTAESDAFKRAAINLGDQFGLGLYNNGQLVPVVKQTLARPPADGPMGAAADLEVVPVSAPEPEPVNETASPIPDGDPDEVVVGFVTALRTAMNDGDVAGILAIKSSISAGGLLDAVYDGKTLAKIVDLAVAHAGKVQSGRAALDEIAEEVQS